MTDRVWVTLERDEDGYPPCDEESIAAKQDDAGPKYWELLGPPLFSNHLSLGDVVEVAIYEGRKWATSVERHSDRSTIRVVAFSGDVHDEILGLGQRFGITVLHTNIQLFFALDIPTDADFRGLWNALRDGVERGAWECFVGSIWPGHPTI